MGCIMCRIWQLKRMIALMGVLWPSSDCESHSNHRYYQQWSIRNTFISIPDCENLAFRSCDFSWFSMWNNYMSDELDLQIGIMAITSFLYGLSSNRPKWIGSSIAVNHTAMHYEAFFDRSKTESALFLWLFMDRATWEFNLSSWNVRKVIVQLWIRERYCLWAFLPLPFSVIRFGFVVFLVSFDFVWFGKVKSWFPWISSTSEIWKLIYRPYSATCASKVPQNDYHEFWQYDVSTLWNPSSRDKLLGWGHVHTSILGSFGMISQLHCGRSW